jgi:hypothetical protein
LLLLRQVHSSNADTSDYMSVLDDELLAFEMFADIDHAQVKQLTRIARALPYIVAQRAVPEQLMLRALTDAQHAEYLSSYNSEMSHVEAQDYDDDEMPSVLIDYMDTVKQGDKYDRMANMHRCSKKKDQRGYTAAQRFRLQAEGCYESALMQLMAVLDTNPSTNPKVDIQLAAEVQRWLDRYVDTHPGNEPGANVVDVPRVSGSGGRYVQIRKPPVVGKRRRRYWRQREALCTAAVPLIYGNGSDIQDAHVQLWISEQLSQKMKSL